MKQPTLDIQNLSVVFDTDEGRISAIQDLSLKIPQGEILAVVGESGCGKSVLCKTIMGLLPKPAQITGGKIFLSRRPDAGPDSPLSPASPLELTGLSEREYCRVRGNDISMVFQDPMTSLDPACPIGAQIAEAIRVHEPQVSRTEARARVIRLMNAVGIDRAAQRYDAFPWMLSGGMRQRCVLAMALAQDCRLLIADEPTTALDVTVQAEILDLLLRLREERDLSVLFISHDLGVVSRIADTVAIMYAGRIVEIGAAKEVLSHPVHPYTWGLIHALPAFAHEGKLRPIPGAPPTVAEGFCADAFAQRNPWALGIDYLQAPPFFEITPNHRAATWLADSRAPKVDFHADARAADERAMREDASEAHPAAGEKSELTAGANAGQTAGPKAELTAGAKAEQAAGAKAELTVGAKAGQTAGAAIGGASTDDAASPLLRAENVSHIFRLGRRAQVRAVEDVSFEIAPGEFFALVGESGSGKTTLARCVLGWYQPASGRILYDGTDICGADRGHLAREIQFISQDPGAALDPRMTVRDLIAEPLQIHGILPDRRQREEYVRHLLQEVQLDERILDRIPAQLSGGQKQRVSIARAYSMNPRLLVADEPLASLDVSIQAQIIELLLRLQRSHGTSILFISHDLAMVELIADRVGVMYRGRLVETARTADLFRAPQHPYTKTLLSSMPIPQHVTGMEVRR